MKALFKLKEPRYFGNNYYSHEKAQKEYQINKRVSKGFYSELISFEEFLKKNNIKIID